MTQRYDIVVLGSGFAGSLVAMVARRLGHTVLIIERARHPRVVIGESSTPLSNLLLEELADHYNLPEIRAFSKWGTWRSQHPEVRCGRKRGFTFLHHRPGSPSAACAKEDLFLVAASPHDAVSDTHWYRADFDHFLLDYARQLGADYLEDTTIAQVIEQDDCIGIAVQRGASMQRVEAAFVVDATGPNGCLHQQLRLDELPVPGHQPTQALYSHFTGVRRLPLAHADHPYPLEDAAVHHLFEEGWVWVLHFEHGVTSAGAVVNTEYAQHLRLHEGAPAWERLLSKLPLLENQFSLARTTMPFRHIPRLSFRSGVIAGKRWALLPSASGFVDPMLSTGFPLTLLGIQRLGHLIEHAWSDHSPMEALADYAAITQREFVATADLLAALSANRSNPAAFRAVSLLYFAAVSFSETAHRLGKRHRAPSFLLVDDPLFGPAMQALLDRARRLLSPQETGAFTQDVLRCIAPFDVAGLTAHRSVPWYPVAAEGLRRSAWKLGATPGEVEQMMARSGFFATP